jgi:hypothetical protein
MAFLTKTEAEAYLREYYEDNYDDETFEEFLSILEDQLDMVSPEMVYAFQIYTE